MNEHYDISAIRDVVKSFTTEKRFSHILGVEKEACELGRIFLPEKCEKLQVAGILHDITKNFSYEKQIELCNEYGIELDKYITPKLLHAKTGCEFARRHFGNKIVDDEIFSAIYYHTTGKAEMSVFEAIIYLADYIEETRTFADCVELRRYFYDNIGKAHSYEDKLEVLRSALVLSFDMTIKNLLDEGKVVDFYTMSARNYLIINEKNLKWRK
jgi:nicotinate-nucleotide adenylyltransferase